MKFDYSETKKLEVTDELYGTEIKDNNRCHF